MPEDSNRSKATPSAIQRWRRRFACAWRGMWLGMAEEEPLHVHLVAAAAVLALGWWLEVPRREFLLLLLCIAAVLAAELFNTAIEHLACAITREQRQEIRNALDTAAGAVLVVALGATVVGLAILGGPLLACFT